LNISNAKFPRSRERFPRGTLSLAQSNTGVSLPLIKAALAPDESAKRAEVARELEFVRSDAARRAGDVVCR
jgi:hypothetical protein